MTIFLGGTSTYTSTLLSITYLWNTDKYLFSDIAEADLIYTETLMGRGVENYEGKEIIILGKINTYFLISNSFWLNINDTYMYI